MILDDEADLLDALSIFLAEASFDVCTVISEELFKMELKRFKPDVIILDVYIKGDCDGRDICKMIKSYRETRHIPVMLMSASKQLLKSYEECKADAVIDKPFDLVFLLGKIRALTHYNKGDTIPANKKESIRLISLIDQAIQNQQKYAG